MYCWLQLQIGFSASRVAFDSWKYIHLTLNQLAGEVTVERYIYIYISTLTAKIKKLIKRSNIWSHLDISDLVGGLGAILIVVSCGQLRFRALQLQNIDIFAIQWYICNILIYFEPCNCNICTWRAYNQHLIAVWSESTMSAAHGTLNEHWTCLCAMVWGLVELVSYIFQMKAGWMQSTLYVVLGNNWNCYC